MGIQINGNTDIISATDGSLTIQGASGNLTGNLTGTATTAQGLTGTPNITVGTIGATSLNASGVVTATSFSGSGANLTGIGGTTDVRTNSLVVSGVSTVTDLRVGTAVTANSNGIQVGAGKSVRIFGSTSGFSDIIASSAAGASELTLPNTSGTLDRLNRAGNVLQVVQSTLTSMVSTSSSTYADLGLSASITPSSSTSKVLVSVSLAACGKSNANSQNLLMARLLRGATEILVLDPNGGYNNTAQPNYFGTISTLYLDSPATTSSTTYKIQIANSANAAAAFVNTNGGTSTITLMEIAA